MKALLLILALAVSATAQSIKEGRSITDWIPIGVGSAARDVPGVTIEGTGQSEMSFAQVKRSDDTFKGWVRFVFPSTSLVKEGAWNELRFFVICDCRKNSLIALTGIAYGVNGNIRAGKSKINFGITEPGSMGHLMFDFFCERGGPPTIAPTLKPK